MKNLSARRLWKDDYPGWQGHRTGTGKHVRFMLRKWKHQERAQSRDEIEAEYEDYLEHGEG